jgi:hypothetical protein
MTDTDPDTDEPTSADRERLHKLEQRLRSDGYVRNKHGFWTEPGVETEPETVDEVEDDEE